MPASPTATPEHIKDVNTRYHDAAADEYDAKWGIDFGDDRPGAGAAEAGQGARRAATGERFGDGLEIGSGTGYFSLNLLQLGVDRAADRDRHLARDAEAARDHRRGARPRGVETVATEAEELPFEDESFDLVFGHAVLHHIPDLDRAFAEFRRVLRPGGAIAFAGEPSRYGDRLAALPKRAGMLVAPAWRRADRSHGRAPSPRPSSPTATRSRARSTSTPSPPPTCAACCATAGFEDRHVGGEELLANAWGWGLRTVESSAEPESVSWGWRNFAFRSYIALQKVDTRAARAPPPRRALLQPARLRPQAGLAVARARGGRGRA